MYMLISSGKASMYELENWYSLDEALKLYAIYSMHNDIERAQSEEMQAKSRAQSRR